MSYIKNAVFYANLKIFKFTLVTECTKKHIDVKNYYCWGGTFERKPNNIIESS
jgi:hypothetical protein